MANETIEHLEAALRNANGASEWLRRALVGCSAADAIILRPMSHTADETAAEIRTLIDAKVWDLTHPAPSERRSQVADYKDRHRNLPNG